MWDDSVFSSTSVGDRQTLSALQELMEPGYVYLEVGSCVGGSLVSHLKDEKCAAVLSVDVRAARQIDERGRYFDNPGNSTERMMGRLDRVTSEAERAKLWTFEQMVEDTVIPEGMADLAFIDAEHTNVAVFRDFLAMRRRVKKDSLIAFHDADLLFSGMENVRAMLEDQGVEHAARYLPDTVFVLAFGGMIEKLRLTALDREDFITRSRVRLWDTIVENRIREPARSALLG